MNGKGDTPRNCHTDEYRANYDAIFRLEVRDRKRLRKVNKMGQKAAKPNSKVLK